MNTFLIRDTDINVCPLFGERKLIITIKLSGPATHTQRVTGATRRPSIPSLPLAGSKLPKGSTLGKTSCTTGPGQMMQRITVKSFFDLYHSFYFLCTAVENEEHKRAPQLTPSLNPADPMKLSTRQIHSAA